MLYNWSEFIQDKDNWINFCKEKNVNSLEDYNELCKLHPRQVRAPNHKINVKL